ncbi:glycosyl transferase [Limnohabitans sp. Jir72]|nr:glycosyl transferase [Limnohabitans sp. Jir72]
MRVAVVHDWLVVYGGAERVLEHILDIYPQADLFTLIDFVPAEQRHFLRGKIPKTSFLQRLPGAHRHYRKMLPLMPLAIEQLDLTDYDLIISSHYSVAKGVLSGPNQVHVCYCHSPMRYAWDHYQPYLREMNLQRGPASWFARWQLHWIRGWDQRSSVAVDQFVANSQFVARRIAKFYGRDSSVIAPPVDTQLFSLVSKKEDFYVCAGRFVPFKRIDLVAEAFAAMPGKKLVLIGDGPEMEKIKSKAGPDCVFTGFLPPDQVYGYLSRARAFIFPSEEDFGIVPVEAQACGTPVIAFGRGGALETVVGWSSSLGDNKVATGTFFEDQTVHSLIQAVKQFESIEADLSAATISRHAQSFSIDSFKRKFQCAVNEALARHAAWQAPSVKDPAQLDQSEARNFE